MLMNPKEYDVCGVNIFNSSNVHLGGVGWLGARGVRGFRGSVGDTGATGATRIYVQAIKLRVKRQAGCPGRI